MKRILTLLALCCSMLCLSAQAPDAIRTQSRFAVVDVYVDSGDEALAAYQLKIETVSGKVRIAGIEGGEHSAFRQPPTYDPKALQRDQVILAAFNVAGANRLPTRRTRVARIHLQILQEAEFSVEVQAAATADGRKIKVQATVEEIKASYE